MSGPKARGRVMWDEDNLDYLEATKSPKRKIDEPKTPYHAPEDSDGAISDDGFEPRVHFDPEAVKSALSEVASSSTANGKRWRRHTGWTSSEDEKDDENSHKDPEQYKRFTELRRAHYDEFRRLKMLRSQSSSWQEEEEERNGKALADASSRGGDSESSLADGVCAIDIQASTAGTPMEN